MTDEMRAAESLVRALAPSGHEVPIPEPLALDESRWLIIAVEKGLLEFTRCTDACARTSAACSRSACDHFETGSDDPHHLFAHIGRDRVALHREYVPAIAAYARAVLDLGYDPPEVCSWVDDLPTIGLSRSPSTWRVFSAGVRRRADARVPRYEFRDTMVRCNCRSWRRATASATRRIAYGPRRVRHARWTPTGDRPRDHGRR